MNVFNFEWQLKKFLLLLVFKHRNIVPICNHNANTRFRKNVIINMPRCHKYFDFISSLNTATILCKDLKININLFKND